MPSSPDPFSSQSNARHPLPRLLSQASTAALREALVRADFTYRGVADLLGGTAHAALGRNETTPGLMVASAQPSPLSTLARLWPLQAAVGIDEAEQALPGLVDPLCAAGILERSVGSVRARVDVRPYADDERDWWVVSDLTPGLDGAGQTVTRDHVLGISSASTTLAHITPRRRVERALDLGTGCGVQSLHLSTHATAVVATDVNRRALAMTALTTELNEVAQVSLGEGSLFDPIGAQQFDLIVTNPPFVVSPGTGELLVYRDSGLPRDEMVQAVVAGAAAHLAPGGTAHILANWIHLGAQTWQERLSEWLDETDCDAWVVQREVADPAQYVELWLRDAGHDRSPDYAARYEAWLRWFEDQGVTGIGFGWINLAAPNAAAAATAPVRRLEEWPFEVALPLGAELESWVDRCAIERLSDAELLDTRWKLRADIRQETTGEPGAADPEAIVLRQQLGMRRAHQVDTFTAAWVGACDGEYSARGLLDAARAVVGAQGPTGDSPGPSQAVSQLRTLVAEGFLLQASR